MGMIDTTQHAIPEFQYEGYVYSLQVTFMSFLFCCTLTLVSGWIPSAVSSSYRKLSNGHKKEWRCRIVALSHSIFAVFTITYGMATWPHPIDPHSMIFGDSLAVRFTESCCLGYFIWDTLIILMYYGDTETDYFGNSGIIHGVMCSIVYIVTLRPFGVFLTGLHLFFEISTPFLNLRWFLIKTGNGGVPIAIINDYVFVASFFLCRICLGPIFAYLYSTTFHANSFNYLNFIFATSMLVSNLLNFYWFYLILRSALVASPSVKKEKSSKAKNEH